MKRFSLLCFYLVLTLESYGQINGYAKVTGISGTTLNLSNVNETFDSFVAGEKAIIIQMQDDAIGSTADDATFGDVGAIGSAGLYEIITIETANTPSSITISASLINSYNTGANSSVQVVTYPTLDDGGGDFSTTGDITALDWDGNIGGVIAFNINGTLTLLHNISADGAGFRGGAANGGVSAGCSQAPYRIASGDNYADKGEGIYRSADANYAAARGKILNGGGGGNSHNAGGGGGGGYSAGGDGGPGWASGGDCTNDGGSAGGLGGIALSAYMSSSRIFMGGGGGAGEGNDGVATAGADGGGIILIAANALKTTSSCSGVSISANGDDAADTGGNDGAGGGGAGGSIVLEIPEYNVVASCPLTVEANGGDGGDVNDSGTHGGGGGGGMGVVVFSAPTPTGNIVTRTDPGDGGANDNSGTGGNAASGGGTPGSGDGVVEEGSTPLPVELINFEGRSAENRVVLNWTTAGEFNNDYFEIQLSGNGRDFFPVGRVMAAGMTTDIRNYQFSHSPPQTAFLYYRLKQVDYDGAYRYSQVIFVNHSVSDESFQALVYPNPVKDKMVRLKVSTDSKEVLYISIENVQGLEVASVELECCDFLGKIEINLDNYSLSPGIYFLNLFQGDRREIRKIVVY